MHRPLLIPAVGATFAAVSLVAAGSAQAAPRGTLTNFSANAVAYGSKTTGNPNVSSGATAAAYFPCTRYVPRSTHNFGANVSRGSTHLTNVDSHNFSGDRPVSITSVNTIQSGSLAGGQVAFTDLRARVRVYHDGTGFHVVPVSHLGSLTIGGVPVPVQSGPQTIPVPGYGTLFINLIAKDKATHSGSVNVMRFEANNGTVTKVGRASAMLTGGVTGGVFAGSAWGSQSTTGGTASTGRTAFKPIACPGTSGKARSTSTGKGTFDFGFLGVQRSTVYGVQGDGRAHGYTHSHIDRARFGGGALVFRNIDGWARVARNRDGTYVKTAKGTGVGTILVNGHVVATPKPGTSRKVAGLGTFSVRDVTKDPTGLQVTAVQVRLFNGSQADTVIKLANAKLHIRHG